MRAPYALVGEGCAPKRIDPTAARRIRVERQKGSAGGGSGPLLDGTLDGIALTIDWAVRNAAEFLSIRARRHPHSHGESRKILGMARKGRIAPGVEADLAVLAPDGSVEGLL